MKTPAIKKLLDDIEKLTSYLHRYAARAATARKALGVPGTRILNRLVGDASDVRQELASLEALQKGVRPLMAVEAELEALRTQNETLTLENAQLRQQVDRHALTAEAFKQASEEAKRTVSTLTVELNKLKSEHLCH